MTWTKKNCNIKGVDVVKKILLIVISAAILVIGSAAFAQEPDFKQGPSQEKDRHSQVSPGKRDHAKDFAIQIKEKLVLIKQQRAEIRDLQQQLNHQIRQTKDELNRLRKQGTSLDGGDISTIKQILGSIQEAHQVLQSTQGAFQVKNSELRAARLHRWPEAFLKALDDVIEIQQKRIDALSGILSDLERLNNQLF